MLVNRQRRNAVGSPMYGCERSTQYSRLFLGANSVLIRKGKKAAPSSGRLFIPHF